MAVPSRTQIAQWRSEVLIEAGTQYADLAVRLRSTMDDVSRAVHFPGDTGAWEGEARRAAEDRVVLEVLEVRKLSSAVDDLASALSEGGGSIAGFVRALIDNATWTESELFAVSDNWQVTDRTANSSAERQNAMANWQAALDIATSSLTTALEGTAQRIRAALDEIAVAAPVSSARMPAGFQLSSTGMSPSRQRAVDYAEDHWKRYNPDYPNYADHGSDCANFVSQVLASGGFEQSTSRDNLNDPNDDDPAAWFSHHDDNVATEDWEASRSWTYAPALHDFLTGGEQSPTSTTPTGTAVTPSSWQSPSAQMDTNALSKSGLQPGDVVFYEKTLPDGSREISHTAVYVGQDWITQPDGSRVWGDVVNMHTSDRYHEPWYLPRYGDDAGNFPITYYPVKVDYPDDPS